jgi:succinylarginine dihydrolase
MKQFEANFDGLVGPTHNYAGLSFGNVASKSNANGVSKPKQAALQGLQKMKALADMGMVQGVLAPQERPDIYALRRLGFSGSDANVMQQAYKQAPHIFLASCSASSMWTANAATVSPSGDTADAKIHFTPANLTNKYHRSLEPQVTGNISRIMNICQTTNISVMKVLQITPACVKNMVVMVSNYLYLVAMPLMSQNQHHKNTQLDRPTRRVKLSHDYMV